MVLNVHRNRTAYWGRGEGVWRWEKREIIYLSLHCHHQNDFCIKMGSDESHFNVSVGSDGQSHKTVSTNHNLFEEKGEPKRYRTEALPLTSLPPYRQARPAHSSFLPSLPLLYFLCFPRPLDPLLCFRSYNLRTQRCRSNEAIALISVMKVSAHLPPGLGCAADSGGSNNHWH